MVKTPDQLLDELMEDPKKEDKVLRKAKIRKDVGIGDQAELDAIRSKIELEKSLKTLFAEEHVKRAFQKLHTLWIAQVETIPSLVLTILSPDRLPMSQKERIKTAIESAIVEIRERIAFDETKGNSVNREVQKEMEEENAPLESTKRRKYHSRTKK